MHIYIYIYISGWMGSARRNAPFSRCFFFDVRGQTTTCLRAAPQVPSLIWCSAEC